MRSAARIVGMAFAPIAGANGGELLLAPSAHAIERQAMMATPTSAANATDAISSRVPSVGL